MAARQRNKLERGNWRKKSPTKAFAQQLQIDVEFLTEISLIQTLAVRIENRFDRDQALTKWVR